MIELFTLKTKWLREIERKIDIFYSQWSTPPNYCQGQSWIRLRKEKESKDCFSESCTWLSGLSGWVMMCCFCKYIRNELEWKQGSWNSTWCSNVTVFSQTVPSSTAPAPGTLPPCLCYCYVRILVSFF